MIRDYGVFNEDMIGLKGIAKRAVFVIDKDGIVRHREVLDDARNEPDYDKVFAALTAAGVTPRLTVPPGPIRCILEHMSNCSYIDGALHGD